MSSKPIVSIRSDDYHSIQFRTFDHEGKTHLTISTEDGGGTTTFFFEDAHEVKLFAKRVLREVESYLD